MGDGTYFRDVKDRFLLLVYIFAGFFIFSFTIGVVSRAGMSIEERVLQGEILLQLDREAKSLVAIYQCGTKGTLVRYEVNTNTVSQVLSRNANSISSFVELIEQNEKGILGATGVTLGVSYKDLTKLRSLKARSRTGNIVVVILGAVSGYYAGYWVSEQANLHCFTEENSNWIKNQDWREVLFEIGRFKATSAHECLSSLKHRLAGDNSEMDVSLTIDHPRLIQYLRQQNLHSAIKFSEKYSLPFFDERELASSDLELIYRADAECKLASSGIKNKVTGHGNPNDPPSVSNNGAKDDLPLNRPDPYSSKPKEVSTEQIGTDTRILDMILAKP
jgi:hypothetical protein